MQNYVGVGEEELLDDDDGEVKHNSIQPGIFAKEVRAMLYGFGDDSNPYQDTVDLIEHLAIEYVIDMTKRAVDVSKSGRVAVEDIIFLIRKDERKFSRVKELLLMNDELKRARKAFEENPENPLERPPTGAGKEDKE